MKITPNHLKLYLVTDSRYKQEQDIITQVENCLKGGVTCVQYREKELSFETQLAICKKLKVLTTTYKVPFIVNDNAILAKAVDADGVHLGQGDGDVKAARQLLGDKAIIGVSAKTIAHAEKAVADGADYLGVGAVFTTLTKTDAKAIDHSILKEITALVKIPVVAIGGITHDNIGLLRKTNIAGVAVVSALLNQKDQTDATKKMLKCLEEVLI
jgi:thiamine-phosphate pyrophosphorylase